MKTFALRSIALATAIACTITMTGCGTMTGIPSHGGGKRFAIEQRLVDASIRSALKSIDVTPLKGKRVGIVFDIIADEGGGTLQGGRMNIIGGLTAAYVQSAVQTANSQFQVFNLADSGTSYSNQGSGSSSTQAGTTYVTGNSTGSSTNTGTNTSTGTSTGSGTSTGTSSGTNTGTSSGTNTGTGTSTGSTTTTTGAVTTNQTDNGSSTSSGTNTGTSSGTNTGTSSGTNTSTGTSTASGSSTGSGTSTGNSNQTSNSTVDQNSNSYSNTGGGTSNLRQTLTPAATQTQTQTKGPDRRASITAQYNGLGEYQNFSVPKSDASLLMGLVRQYLLLSGVQPTIPTAPEAKVILYVTVSVFGLVRSRFDAHLFNQESVIAETAIEMTAFDKQGNIIMRPRNANKEVKYDENYILWVGPFKTDEEVRKGKGLLVDFSDVDGTKATYESDTKRHRWSGNSQ